ncbi:hypothetical protein ABZU45_38955 [Streptomyces avermitilis]|uniref:hypothetical protein n=1 Tax=Streptomyces avermitilis TaxID=33903 RepID=UPI0033B2E714
MAVSTVSTMPQGSCEPFSSPVSPTGSVPALAGRGGSSQPIRIRTRSHDTVRLAPAALAMSTAEKNRALMAKNMMIATADVTRPVMPVPLPVRVHQRTSVCVSELLARGEVLGG